LEGVPGFHASDHAGGIPVYGIQNWSPFRCWEGFLLLVNCWDVLGQKTMISWGKINIVDALPSPKDLDLHNTTTFFLHVSFFPHKSLSFA